MDAIEFGLVPANTMLRCFRAMGFRNRQMKAIFGAQRIINNKVLVDTPALIKEL